ncbi:hypothetical protein TSMEX_009807 [Taenia solium]|eukprot:TsM_000025700 transcript=TsM_000025700 gene=TsM_000025700
MNVSGPYLLEWGSKGEAFDGVIQVDLTDASAPGTGCVALGFTGAGDELAALVTAEVDSVALDIIEVCIKTVASAGVTSDSVALGVSEFGVSATRLVDGVDFSVALCATGACVKNVTLVGDEDDIIAFAATLACVDAVVLVTDGMGIIVVDIFGACVAAVAPAVVWCSAVALGAAKACGGTGPSITAPKTLTSIVILL